MEQKRELDPHKYTQQIFDKGTEATQWKEDGFFKKMVLKQLDIDINLIMDAKINPSGSEN